jgi:type I restriction enzyme S subunit
MPFGLKDNDYKLIKNVFHSISKIEEVIVFGSRAMGTDKPASDVDLALKGNDITLDDILKLKHKLEELPIIYDFDVINYETINTPALIEHIDRHGILFYKKDIVPKYWKTYSLGDFAEINPKISLKQGQEYSFVEMKDLDATFKYVSPSTKKELKGGSKFQNGDTLFARITPCLENGKICQVKNLENNVGFGSTEFLVFRGRKNVSDSDFVYYLSRSEFVKNNAIQLMTGSSGRQRVEKSTLAELEIIVPKDIETQKQIAHILTSLDDKIELNLQMNQNLEAMAQSLFKEWFVDFKFPGFDGVLVNGLPKGWKLGKFSDIVKQAKKTIKPDLKENYQYYLPIDCIDKKTMTLSKVEPISNANSSLMEFLENDILFGAMRSYFHKVIIAPFNGVTRSTCFVFRPIKLELLAYAYLVCFQDETVKYSNQTSKGSTMPYAVWEGGMENMPVIIPDEIIYEKFYRLIIPMIERIKNTFFQNQNLIKTRDNLLPRLMSGKIKIEK